MKKFWTYIKHQKTYHQGISSLKQDGKLITDPIPKTNVMNGQFKSVFSNSDTITESEFETNCKLSIKSNLQTMPDITVTCEGIAKLLLNLNPNKAAGSDEIKPRVQKELATEIPPISTINFQISLDSGVVPSDWKTAHVVPVYKKGPKYNPENHRPISLTCICCKLLEHIVVGNIMSHADKYSILYPFQHGFHKFRSCETQLLEFIDDVTRNLDDGKQTDVLIMDFSKAFDKVSHNLLIHKLKHYGIRGKVTELKVSYHVELRQSLLRVNNLHTSLSILECPMVQSLDQVCSYTT
jgi:hypothetical protein